MLILADLIDFGGSKPNNNDLLQFDNPQKRPNSDLINFGGGGNNNFQGNNNLMFNNQNQGNNNFNMQGKFNSINIIFFYFE